VARVDLPVAVAVLLLRDLLAALEVDEGVHLAVAVGVGLAVDRRVSVHGGDDLRLAVAVRVLLLAHLLSVLEEAHEVAAAVVVGVDLLAGLAALFVEEDHELVLAVAVLVAGLAALLALLEEGDALEAAVEVGVGLAAHDLVALGVGDDVGLPVVVGVL